MSPRYLLLLGFVVLAVAIGVSACKDPRKGYAPEQPIAFSHQLHAGTHEIPCGYCHVAAGEGPQASVPSLNICMNCHSSVATGRPEVQKLTQHWREGRPVEWIQVHDLPDHVLFSHQPHLARGIDCSECHGQVNRMDVVEVVAPMTMGWCVNCHRQPEYNAPVDCFTCHY
ncbi:MAG: cytochrome c3 family protein [Bradymonadaceae bacterium]|nr:cytochrome c3 family protein [Lujinxingiaceae bacterium]